VRITTTQPSCGRSPFIRMQHTLSQLTMRPGGAGRLHLELVFFIKTLTQIQSSLLIKAPVSKNVYIRYVPRAAPFDTASLVWFSFLVTESSSRVWGWLFIFLQDALLK
jgi:hypothetical protein